MKKRILFKYIIICFCFMFLSCATTVNVKLTRPAHLDLNGARTIAILPFKPCAYYKEYNTSLGMEILINSFYQIFDIRDPDEQLAIDSLRTQIERGLLDSPYIKLVSSEAVETAKRKGKQIGRKQGAAITTKKSIKAKQEILKYSRDFNGTLTDVDCMRMIGIARNTYYRYKAELKATQIS